MSLSVPDFEKLARTLAAHSVEFVVVGGFALALQGGDNLTTDVDLALDPSPENRGRTAEALNSINPRLKRGLAVHLDAQSFGGEFCGYQTDAGPVDIINRILVEGGFPGLYERALSAKLFGVEVRIARLEDLRAMKANSDRDRDRDHVRQIDALIALRDEALKPDS